MHPLSIDGRTRVVTATGASQRVTGLPDAAYQVEIGNAGPGWAYVHYGREDAGNTITAIVPTSGESSYPIAPGHAKVITIGSANVVAVIADSAGATVYVTPCTGA